ncbi:MAG: ABC transporter permease subunit [Capsulimonadales bacterium]|nr:ABC transporter permease subunit [Capsulimonadales bacterium]
MTRNPLAQPWRRISNLARFVANPVVVRDLRSHLRSPRSFWLIGGYLLLLGFLAVAGYAQSTGQTWYRTDLTSANPVDVIGAQANLEGFYNFIFGTLAGMILLVAPALTAHSIVGERQRQSFDLLVTTPLTAGQILIGKLISSIAFMGLLLILSLPATALCLLLGGANVADVLRIYFVLAVDAVVLSAIGLYFSCAVRVPLLATVWTYISVLGFTFLTFVLGMSMDGSLSPLPGALLWLSPLGAISPVSGNHDGLYHTTRLLAFAAFAVVLVRQLIAAGTYRLGRFGTESAVFLRKQALLIAGVMTLVVTTGISSEEWIVNRLTLFLFLTIAPFLPGLFVPATGEALPPPVGNGTTDAEDREEDRTPFRFRNLFRPVHSGAFPWYLALVGVVFAGWIVGTIGYERVRLPMLAVGTAFCGYLLGMGTLAWGLSRLAGTLVSDLSSARATAFGLLVAVCGLPVLLLTFASSDWTANPLAPLWLLSPWLRNSHYGHAEGLIRSGIIAAAVGWVVFGIDLALSRRASDRTTGIRPTTEPQTAR